jgi:hypothetical protein
MVSTYAATPIKLSFPSQFPNAVAGKSYTDALSTRVSEGIGKPYSFKLTGALPTGLNMSTKGESFGAIPKTAKNGKYVLKICATGAKKAGSTVHWNTGWKFNYGHIADAIRTAGTICLAMEWENLYRLPPRFLLRYLCVCDAW